MLRTLGESGPVIQDTALIENRHGLRKTEKITIRSKRERSFVKFHKG
ncbi:hypothetical protein SAMN05216339_101135 [Nitrosomonas eutropha]|uniref:Uncharacterized protein n=1 Tax=Nitrosomonas eutropha TaxID=916 RepID=A0A1I7EWU0_9PROT|nr:hypothetical protein SAMN05216339_101135 [Nitrosomonas eutropha]